MTTTTAHPLDRLLTRAEVAELAGVHPRTVMRAERRGQLRAVRLGARTIRYTESAVRHWLGQS